MNRLALRENISALLFLSPWFIGLLVLSLGPMAVSLYLSMTDYTMLQSPDWAGIENYRRLGSDPRFVKALQVTLTYVFLGVPLQLLTAFSLALFLNRGMKGLNLFRAIYYIPSILGPSVAVAILWRQVFGYEGIVNGFLALFGLEPRSWVGDPSTALYTLILLLVWQFGSPMIIFLAGLRQIPAELYEAASIDGAGVFSRFFRITLPSITPIILFNLIMQVINAFQAFTPAYIVGGGQGGAMDSTLFYTLYLYIKAFTEFRMGYASALAWVLLAICGVFVWLLFLSSRKWVHYES
ncbi:MAG TPA: sugar ABC transporter permease [Paenibacillaceae bacterium]